MSQKTLTDVHAHLAALPTRENGCRVSRKLLRGPFGRAVMRMQGLDLSDPEGSNRRYIENLEIELKRCKSLGAVLVKTLPNSQGFDPCLPGFKPFYKALRRLKLPLLSHVGHEFAVIAGEQRFGNPELLIPALDEGVTVIAAHGGSSGLFVLERNLPVLLGMMARYPNLYADVSAMTLPNRVRALFLLARHSEAFGRLLFGTDYPIPVFAYPCLAAFSVSGFLAARSAASRFDRQARVLREVGIILTRDFLDLNPG